MKIFNNFSYLQKAFIVILFFTAVRIILSDFLGLGNDESYYWTYAYHLQWNYFDHPPLVALWIRFFTANLLLQDHVFFIRLGSIISCAASSYFIFKAISTISTERAALLGIFLYNISFYGSITAGLIITPDVPQMVFWTLSLYILSKISLDTNSWKNWLLFGVSAGLCIMSKVHGVFLWGGIFLYALFYKRQLFTRPQIYVAALITLIIVAPIIIWNIQNDFITYRFHSERVTIHKNNGLHRIGFFKEIIGQLIVNNPFNIALIIFFLFIKKRIKHAELYRILKLTALPLLAVIFLISLFRQSLPHWSGPAYITLLPIGAIGLAEMAQITVIKIIRWAFLYTTAYYLLLIAAVNFYPGTFGKKTEPYLGKTDISLDAYGWKEAGEQFGVIYNKIAAGSKHPLVCNDWWGAHEEYYFARPLHIEMIGLGLVNVLHNYAWKNKYTIPLAKRDTAFCIVHSDEYYDVKKAYAAYYTKIDSLTTIQIFRNHLPAHNFYVYRLSGWLQ